MKVRDLMTKEVKYCAPDLSLAVAAGLMWNTDCGVLPVMDDGKLAGIITDRDICIALGTGNSRACDIAVRDVATHDVQTCAADADVHQARSVMRRARVRRLPVLQHGKLAGIPALNDIVKAVNRKHGDLDYEEVMNAMKALCEHLVQKHAETAVAPTSKRPIPVSRWLERGRLTG
jgi:CBS domain-containing protein